MPSSLIIIALVVAWLVVLVPMMARKRQESARSVGEEYDAMPDAEYDDIHDIDDDYFDEEEYVERPFRRGRGGYDPEAAVLVAQAKYAFRRRVVAFLLVAAVATGIVGVFYAKLWYGHAALDLVIVGYLTYLRFYRCGSKRRSARSRLARLQQVRRRRATGPQQQETPAAEIPQQATGEPETAKVEVVEDRPAAAAVAALRTPRASGHHPGRLRRRGSGLRRVRRTGVAAVPRCCRGIGGGGETPLPGLL